MKEKISVHTTVLFLLTFLLVTLASCSEAHAGTEQPPPPGTGTIDQELGAALSASGTGCTVTSGPLVNGSPSPTIMPPSGITSQFTRSIAPKFNRQGGWSSGTYVKDSTGLAMNAVVTTTTSAGVVSLPIESGETFRGATLYVCGDGTTSIAADTQASHFTSDAESNLTDGLWAIGSAVEIPPANKWTAVDVDTYTILVGENGMLWMTLYAVQFATPLGTPPSMSLAQVVMHMDH